jgi:hypothetical protein
MPTFGHMFYGLAILIPILYFTKNENGQFNYKLAFIFLANNIFGPDAVALFFIIPAHNILGFLVLAIPLSLVFTYASRFSLKESGKKFFPLKFVDEGIREVKWKNAYCATAAGGISHFLIDQFGHLEQAMHLAPGIDITYDQMLAWGTYPYHTFTPFTLIGYIIIVTTIILSLYYFRKGSKQTFIYLLISTGVVVLLMLFVTADIFDGELEFFVIVFAGLYILIPLSLLMYAARDIKDNPNTTPDVPKIKRTKLLYIVSIITMLIALFFIAYAYFAITNARTIASMITHTPQSEAELARGVIFFGYVFLVSAVLLLFSSIGLLFKLNFCRYIVISICSYMLIFGFPIAIALFLNEKDIKEIFGKETE